MNILVIGSGGREHTLTWKLAQSKQCSKLFVAPGNAGTDEIALNVDISVTDFEAIKKLVLDEKIDLVVVGPEAPLVAGIVDFFKADADLKNINIVGPDAAGAQLEGSKDFSKDFMVKYGVPTAFSKTFNKDSLEEGKAYIDANEGPYVLKADGLAAGKGVIITENADEAKQSLHEMLAEAKFGDASSKVLIEQFLTGIELSVFVLTDGKNYVILPEAKDYKRIGEGDTGLNTGGMGAVSPVPFATEDFLSKVEEKVVKPTLEGLQKEGIHYVGFIFIGLMNQGGEPQVIEYNVRMGDPETQVVFPRIQTDVAKLFKAAAEGTLNKIKLKVTPKTAVTSVVVAGGYPETYKKGDKMDLPEGDKDKLIFHAGTALQDGKVVTNGGRVMALTGMAKTLNAAVKKSQSMARKVKYKGKYYRKDIGQDLLALIQK
ncbi:phosphoribosylamine--glycine ligase [Jiulongibacter sediminis]|uniref:Phosphoribosylamine--glycine ligase n=1 Tax=Jiulongibacter sediminis TaxID=1605367 RepID=A0A0P7BBE3_9BACT|nr:phosphoribosylamine--glycine ligase [Jiulongibacter sediminis]KPM47808.1 phosphoribosylamine--glycine ligase [Jiulongibacter sediminis]TBX23992.1 phosphoribosylamine--glycine ligase [Jiulongibacter sediminis]